MKIPAKYVANEFVRIVMLITKMSGGMMDHSSELVIIAAKTCVSHVDVMAYAVDVTPFIAQYVRRVMMEWMLANIVKVTRARRNHFALGAEYPRSTMTVGDVSI